MRRGCKLSINGRDGDKLRLEIPLFPRALARTEAEQKDSTVLRLRFHPFLVPQRKLAAEHGDTMLFWELEFQGHHLHCHAQHLAMAGRLASRTNLTGRPLSPSGLTGLDEEDRKNEYHREMAVRGDTQVRRDCRRRLGDGRRVFFRREAEGRDTTCECGTGKAVPVNR